MASNCASVRLTGRPDFTHRLLVGGSRPDRRRHGPDVAAGCDGCGGGNHSAAGDGTGISCQAELFLIAGNVTRAMPYRIAAHKRTLLNPASRAIRFASGVATTENAPFSPHAQGRNPPFPPGSGPAGTAAQRDRHRRDRARAAGRRGRRTANPSVARIDRLQQAACATAHQAMITTAANSHAAPRPGREPRASMRLPEAGEHQHSGQHEGKAVGPVAEPEAGLLDQIDLDEQEAQRERRKVDRPTAARPARGAGSARARQAAPAAPAPRSPLPEPAPRG